jgi:TPR repeat protein
MLRQMFLTALFAAFFSLLPARAAGQIPAPSSEDVKTRLDKQEIIDLMARIGRMSRPQQDRKMDLILKDQSVSKTPRSDFMFCTGLAYLGDSRAQECVGRAFEKGIGTVEDMLEAYTWFALALENRGIDKAAKQRVQADKERVLTRLRSAYPSPTDDDLEDMVRAQESRIAQYQEEAKRTKS